MRRLLLILAILLLLSCSPGSAENMALDYLCRYIKQTEGVDRLMDAVQVGPNRAVICSTSALALVDLSALPAGGSTNYLHRITGYNARDVYLKDNYIYVNEYSSGASPNPWGFSVVRVGPGDVLTHITRIGEPGVFYDKMCVSGNYLYVAAHSHGIRIFDISNPASPTLIGSITTGFTDAFAIHVEGSTAYVADGGGGLKVVDVSDSSHPVLLGGENMSTATGTAEAVTYRNGKVYVASGGAGLAVYDAADIRAKTLIPLDGFIEDLCWLGDYLVVSGYLGITVFDTTAPGGPVQVARELSARRGPTSEIRLCAGVGAADDNRILVANWYSMDVYQLKPISQSTQPDILSTEQRVRLSPSAGSAVVTLTNNGGGNLIITGVQSTSPAFSTDYTGGTLTPGQSMTFNVNYDGSPTGASGILLISSNDPDENPLPIEFHGNTVYLDPTEEAIDFTLPILERDPDTGAFNEGTFTLSDQIGKVVYLTVFASW